MAKKKSGLARHARADKAQFAQLKKSVAACRADVKALHQGVVGLAHAQGMDIAKPIAAYRAKLAATASAYGGSCMTGGGRPASATRQLPAPAHRRPAKGRTLVARYNPRTGRYEVPASAHPTRPRGGCGRREHVTQEYRARANVAHPGEFLAGPCMIDRSGKLKHRVRDRHGRLR